MRLFLGNWADAWGRRRVALAALVLYGAGRCRLTSLLRPNLLFAVGAGLGLAHGLLYPSLNALAVEGVPRARRGAVMSYFFGCFGAGSALWVLGLGVVAKSLRLPGRVPGHRPAWPGLRLPSCPRKRQAKRVTLKRRILLTAFTTSFSGTLLQRGAYFYTHQVLGFSQAQNLWLALLVGVTYIAAPRPAIRSARASVNAARCSACCSALVSVHLLHRLRPLGRAAGRGLGRDRLSARLDVADLRELHERGRNPAQSWPRPQSLQHQLGALRAALAGARRFHHRLWLTTPAVRHGGHAYLAWSRSRVALFPKQPAHLEADHAERPNAALLHSYRSLLARRRVWPCCSATP